MDTDSVRRRAEDPINGQDNGLPATADSVERRAQGQLSTGRLFDAVVGMLIALPVAYALLPLVFELVYREAAETDPFGAVLVSLATGILAVAAWLATCAISAFVGATVLARIVQRVRHSVASLLTK